MRPGAFPEELRICEVQRPGGQKPLLEHPASFVDGRVGDARRPEVFVIQPVRRHSRWPVPVPGDA